MEACIGVAAAPVPGMGGWERVGEGRKFKAFLIDISRSSRYPDNVTRDGQPRITELGPGSVWRIPPGCKAKRDQEGEGSRMTAVTDIHPEIPLWPTSRDARERHANVCVL